MTLIVEDGTGKWNAESLLSVADLDLLAAELNWTDWPAAGVSVPAKEAAARKGTRYMEAQYGRLIAGEPKVNTQRLTFPKSGTFYYPDFRQLPSDQWLPPEARAGYGEAIRRAYNGTLSPDLKRGGKVIQKTIGPLTTVWSDGAPAETVFPEIEDAIRPLWWSPWPIQVLRA